MTPPVAQLLWLCGLGLLVAAWARQVARARAVEPAPVPRAEAALIAALIAALAAGGAAAWGGLVADDGLARAAARGADDDAPARARLFLRHVQLMFGPDLRATVGYGPNAQLLLPRDYGLDEAGKAQDVFTVAEAGPRALSVTAAGSSRVLVAVVPGAPDEGLAAARRALLDGRRCRAAAPPPAAVDGPATTFVLLCTADEPRALLGLERELPLKGTAPVESPLRVTPYVWRANTFRPHHVHLDAGTLLQIGAGRDALPGVTVWEIPAPAGRPGLMFPPKNLLAPCKSWLEGNAAPDGGFFLPGLGVVETPTAAAGDSFACVLPFTPPFALEVRRLIPDTAGVWLRSSWAAGLVGLPAALLLLVLAAARGSARAPDAVARALGLGVVAVALAALAVIRLTVAHRLDMLRDYEPSGARVGANELYTVLLAAALAGVAVAAHVPARRAVGRAAAAIFAWGAMLAAGAFAILPDVAVGLGVAPQLAVSLALGTAPIWWHKRALVQPALVALALMGLALALAPARAVALKLAAAWALPPLAYLGLRAALGRPPRHALAAAALVLVDLLLLARLDTGIAAVIAGVGLLVALALAAQDALYTDADARVLDAAARARPFVAAQAAAVLVLGATITAWAASGILAADADARLPQIITRAALHALLPVAALFAGAAALAWRERRARAIVWATVAAALVGVWAARDLATTRVLAGRNEASARVAAIVDPAYALLADERAFAKGLTAWRETAAAAPLATGQGYFGAQVLDPGVLLSIENDYLPVLVLRESGAGGLARLAALPIGLALALGLVGAARFRAGSAAARARRVVAILLGLVALYQPVASLGALPFTGVTWPGLGIDSPSDLWIFVALLLFLAVLGDADAPVPRRASRVSRLAASAAAAAAIASVLLVARVGVFALRRREPVEQRAGQTVKLLAPFDGLEAVFDYTYRMRCADGDAAALARPLLAEPSTPALARWQDAFLAAWDEAAAPARERLARVRAGDVAACEGRAGRWRFERRGDGCRATFKLGWPAVTVTASGGKTSCDVAVDDDVLRAFRYPPRRPFAGARVRLVSRALGDAARDAGELVSGAVVVRLRPGAGLLDASAARAGISVAEQVTLGEDVEVLLDGGVPKVRRGAAGKRPARVLVVDRPQARVHLLEQSARWETKVLDPRGAPTPLGALSVIVVGGGTGRNVWLFRPPSRHPGDVAPTVDPLLADDVTTVLGTRRRHYTYGGLLPELGWVNPGLVDRSLGLDGWTHAAVARWERDPAQAARGASAQSRVTAASCGTLAPPAPAAGDEADAAFARVCSRSPLDDVLECRVSLQPELETRLRHLLELSAARPELFAGKKGFFPATAASFALLRGDTGEILAQGNMVPGRESTAYAPATPSLEKVLLAARDDRDPTTGARGTREESGAEKADWPQAIAVGSTMKPLVAHALERAAPDLAPRLVLTALGKRAGCEPVFGHCPPTKTLWNHTERPADLGLFLGESLNWFQAAVGLLGTALPDGEFGYGSGPAVPLSFPIAVEAPREDVDRLWTRYGGRDVIRGANLDAAALRRTPLWRELEAVLGRPLCTGDKVSCARAAERRDLCAARALPVEDPSPDLRHLVAAGPSSFDFSDGDRHLVKEYLQLLRGSGKHPLASTLQLADAMNRVFFDPGAAPYRLAASWFPVAPTGVAPAACTRVPSGRATTRAGLCRALQDGTAALLAPRLDDRELVFYGAKTGTIDSLGDVVENRRACEAWNRAHTIDGAAEQPYHLDCTDPARKDLNDSLLVIGFGVKTASGVIPMTLALRYQRAGSVNPYGYAVHAAGSFLDVILDYFAS